MKKILLFIIIHCLVSSSIIAQDSTRTDYIRGGIGFVNLRTEYAPKLELEYIKPIGQRFNFGISLNLAYTQSKYSVSAFTGTNKHFLTFIDPNIYLKVITTDNFHMYTGLGASLMFIASNDVSNTGNYRSFAFTVGGNLVVQLNYDLNQDTALGLRLTGQPYLLVGVLTGASFNLIKKLSKETNE